MPTKRKTSKKNLTHAATPRCFKCGILKGERDAYVYFDPILDVDTCIVCAHQEAFPEFIRERTDLIPRDKENLIAQLGLSEDGEPLFPIPGMIRASSPFEWSTQTIDGSEYGAKWKYYLVEITDVVIGHFPEPNHSGLINFQTHCFLWEHPDDPRKVLWPCRLRVFYKASHGFLEKRYSHESTDKKARIENADLINSKEELSRVWNGLQIFIKSENKGGRPPGSGWYPDPEQFRSKLVSKYNSLAYDEDPTQKQVARCMGLSLRSFERKLATHRISWPPKKSHR